MMSKTVRNFGTSLVLTCGLLACGAESMPNAGDNTDALKVPSTYAFESRFVPGESSVSYSGQVFRQRLIADLKSYFNTLTARLDGGWAPLDGDVVDALNFYYQFDGDTSGDLPHSFTTTPGVLQSTYADIASGKDLRGKIAGNDTTGQHRNWSIDFVGWSAAGVHNPDALVASWFEAVEHLAIDRANGTIPLDPSGQAIGKAFVTADGLDYQQLLHKFLLGAVAFSQGADDYLDDDIAGKGLLADNTVAVEGKSYTALEHAWDEGFGYFGAARDYANYTDDEIAGKGGRAERAHGYYDSNADGHIDLLAEVNVGHAVNAAKRDRGSSSSAPTDYTADAFGAFLRGRAIIHAADGALDDDAMMALREARDDALMAWENAIAATAVHYLNDVLQMMQNFDTDDYDFLAHAKTWSELKGFALSLQFNPHSPLSDADFAALHDKLGQAPALPGQGRTEAYATALREARDILGNAYGFAAANLGDAQGEGGW